MIDTQKYVVKKDDFFNDHYKPNEIFMALKNESINISVFTISNIIVKFSGDNLLKPIRHTEPIPSGHYHYTLELTKPITDIKITFNKPLLKRLWYRMQFKPYHSIVYNIRIQRHSLSLLD